MSTDERPTCPACGAALTPNAPEGLCARCVVEEMMHFAGLDSSEAEETLGEIGDYEILGKIAAGGMGVVYRARQKGLGRLVALKLVAEGKLASRTDKERFLMEARAVGDLDHPNIVPIYEVGEENGQYFFSMRLVSGGNFDEWLRDHDGEGAGKGTGTWAGFRGHQETVVRLLLKVAQAVHYAHDQGILHRDLKPANILIDQRGEPQISDFGLAKRVREDTKLTASGQLLGSPAYMAPEQAEGRNHELTPAADIYAIGVMLYQALAGRTPFTGNSPMALLQESLTKEPKPLRKINPRIDRDLETITLCCLEKVPQNRYDSAAALAKDLERWLDGRPIQAKPAGPVRRLVKWARRKPSMVALLAFALLAGSIIGGILWRHQVKESERTREAYVQDISRAKAYIDEKRLTEALTVLTQHEEREFAWHLLWKRCLPRYDSLALAPENVHALAASSRTPGELLLQMRSGEVKTWRPGEVMQAESFLQPGAPPPAEMLRFHGGGTMFLGKRADDRLSVFIPGTDILHGPLPEPLLPPEGGFLAAAPGERPSLFITTAGRRGDDVMTWTPPWKEGSVRLTLTDDLLALAISPRSQNPKVHRHYAVFCFRARLELWKWEANDVFVREAVIQRKPSPTATLAFSPNGKLIIAGDASGTVRAWNREPLAIALERQHAGAIQALTTFDAGGIHRIAAADAKGEVRVWDFFPEDPAPLRGLEPPFGIAPDGRALVAMKEGQVTLLSEFDAGTPRDETLAEPPKDAEVIGLALIDSAPPVVAAITVQPQGGVRVQTLAPEGWTPWPAAATDHIDSRSWIDQRVSGHHWMVLLPDGRVTIFDLQSGDSTRLSATSETPAENWRIYGPDPALVYSMESNVITRHGNPGGKEGSIRLQSDSPGRHFVVSPDQRTLAIAHVDGHLRLWHAATGRLLLELENQPWETLAFSADGSVLIAYERSGSLHIWDTRLDPAYSP